MLSRDNFNLSRDKFELSRDNLSKKKIVMSLTGHRSNVRARKTTHVFAYLDYKRILTFYAYDYFETESLYPWIF